MTNFNTLRRERSITLLLAAALGLAACTSAETSESLQPKSAARSHEWPEPKCTNIIPKMDTRDPQTFYFEVITEDIDMKDGYALNDVDFYFNNTASDAADNAGAIRQPHTFSEGGKTYTVSATLTIEKSPDAPMISRDGTINCPEIKVSVP